MSPAIQIVKRPKLLRSTEPLVELSVYSKLQKHGLYLNGLSSLDWLLTFGMVIKPQLKHYLSSRMLQMLVSVFFFFGQKGYLDPRPGNQLRKSTCLKKN